MKIIATYELQIYMKAKALLVHIHGLSLRILHGLYMALLVQSFAYINALLHKICFNLVTPAQFCQLLYYHMPLQHSRKPGT
jgi:hypothetical protein